MKLHGYSPLMQHFLLYGSCISILILSSVNATTFSCLTDDDCAFDDGVIGSECLDGKCTNPFYNKGCLHSYLPREKWDKVRVCNSEDPPDAEKLGYCRSSPFDYKEIRALAMDWDTAIFSTWVLQILLSEVLDVPSSVETGFLYSSINFYDQTSRMDTVAYDMNYKELTLGSEVVDCRTVGTISNSSYQACANVITENWYGGVFDNKPDIENPRNLGALGGEHWFIPKFTAVKNPTLVSYVALAGERNRRKLAKTFKRPTTWKVYCEEISKFNCSTSDKVAIRPPQGEIEEMSYFVEGLYTGHFRATDDNDCDTFPDTCTGHIADYPCGWVSYIKQQTYHLGIHLKGSGPSPNGGYEYDHLVQIWSAANATKSDVIMYWWDPEPLYQEYIGTDAEFTRVILPPPTQECFDNRANFSAYCGDNETAKVGSPKGACDTYPVSLQKLISSSLQGASSNSNEPQAMWSPAYDGITGLQITGLQYGDMFKKIREVDDNKWNFGNKRDSTCRWVVENLEYLQSLVPNSYPRIIKDKNSGNSISETIALVLGYIAGFLVMICYPLTHNKRRTKAIYYTQRKSLYILLAGLFMSALGALVMLADATISSCLATVWLTNIGNALVLLPLVLRIQRINKISSEGTGMQRVRLEIAVLSRFVGSFLCLVVVFLIFWTIYDAPEKTTIYELTEEITPEGETIVHSSDLCKSESSIWEVISFSWQGLLLLPAIVIAAIASRIDKMNDTRTLGMTFLGRIFFLILGVTVFTALAEDNSERTIYSSLLLSVDTIVTLLIYVFPKFWKDTEEIKDGILPDLFLNTTIMLANVEGFVAWSSVREPIQVFKFLESLFENFDKIADRMKIFKVETTGQYYVAASGVPESRSDHAVVMAKFASEILKKMDVLSEKLELQFGPDTSDLTLRIGLHSGPVTGGFMKGKQSQFQLVGDTMTTASVIHELGDGGCIHISEATANLLIKDGKHKWVRKRETKLQTVGKGEIQSYWLSRYKKPGQLDVSIRENNSVCSVDTYASDNDASGLDSEQRWIEWNTSTLLALLKKVGIRHSIVGEAVRLKKIGARNSYAQIGKRDSTSYGSPTNFSDDFDFDMPLDEVREIIELPDFDKETTRKLRNRGKKDFEISPRVESQLREYVSHVASKYRGNPFHNFAHASYVVMAVTKYMNRIMEASEMQLGKSDQDRRSTSVLEAIHDHTYGITSDPLTQFACVFAALIHDVDHPGVPNPRLIQENKQLAERYKNRSVAEQQSLDIAWEIFMRPNFDDLRAYLCNSESELRRFRQLVVNSVMATDLGDKDLKKLRNDRWAKAFSSIAESPQKENPHEVINRKATIVIEHLIQAADIAHMCQHWNIYRKWNQRLFEECYAAYKSGRATTDPAESWYQGEIGFYDFYVIPLSKKLRDCGVFGPTSDENLNYAESNRAQWEREGKSIVQEMLAQVNEAPKIWDDMDAISI